MRVWIIIIIVCCCISLQFPQELNFRNIDVEQGLAQSIVNCIYADTKGFVWIGTQGGGISRFNGREFENFDRTNGLSNELVCSFLEDQNQQMWIGTHSGVFKYNGNVFEKMDPTSGYPSGQVWDIKSDNEGRIYFADTERGVVVKDGGRLYDIPELTPVTGKFVITLLTDDNGILWIGSATGLYKYADGKIEQIKIPGIDNPYYASVLFKDSDRNLWVGSYTGLFRLKDDEWRSFNESDGLTSLYIWAFHESDDGTIRIGTQGGLAVFDGEKFSVITEKDGLSNNFVTALAKDREDNLWLGTNEGISIQLNWCPFISYSSKSGLKDNNVWSFFEENTGNILVSSDKGIDTISIESGKVLSKSYPYSEHTFYPMFMDKEGIIWLCSKNKILQIRNQKVVKTYDTWKYKFDFFYKIFQDTRERIWFVTQTASVILYENGKFRQFSDLELFNTTAVLTIAEDKNGKIWFGSDRGLFYYEANGFKREPKLNNMNEYYVNDILAEETGTLWVGTYAAGLFKIDPDSPTPILKTFVYPTELPEKNIISMVFDDSGDLWVGTNMGVFRLLLNEENSGTVKYQYLSGKAGMKALRCNENAIFKDREGRIWVGTTEGAVIFDPRKTSMFRPDPLIYITGVKIYPGKKEIHEYSKGVIPGTNLPLKLKLPHSENNISFNFIGITSAIPKKVKYRWRLNKVSQEWSVPVSQEQINFSNLSSGDYKFEVQCSSIAQNWKVPIASFSFTITSPFWKKTVFKYLGAVFILSILISIFYSKSLRMKAREVTLQKRIEESTEELTKEKNKVEMINRDLEERVIQRTNELEQKNMELVQAQKLEIIGSLAGGVAHDLNNILSGVVSYPDLLLKTIDEKDPNRKYIEIIKDSGEKAAEMVQDLLTLTRKGVINKEPISINEIIKEFLNSPVFMKLKKNNSHISYSSDLTSEKTYIFGSSIHITKTIMNLIINASEAMPIDGAIEISTIRCFLDEPLKGYDRINEGDYIKLTMKDNGIGIEKKDLTNIFEPFFSKKRMGKSGTGLGMTVVLWTIKDHYGYVIVNSIKGKGTEFQLYFPAAMYDIKEEKEIPESEVNTSYIGKGEHILIVEDDDNNRELAEKILSECNFRVSSVSSGEEAVKFVENEKVDLLILDMIMGGIDGLETYIQILMRKGEQKAVITSGYSDNENVKETIKLGAGAYIKKPYLKMQLIKAVESELRKI